MVNNKWCNVFLKEQGNSDESAQISPKSSESDDLPASQHKTPEKVQKKASFQPKGN